MKNKSKEYPSLLGKRIAVSGSTGGIGRELCLSLSRLGASIICLDRNAEKVAKLNEELGGSALHIRCDLSDMKSVMQAADRLIETGADALVLCAGAYHIPRTKCESGFDNVFQINFIAPYCLAKKLKPHLRARGGRLVAVGSIAQSLSRFDPQNPEKRNALDAVAYGNAKRCLSIALSELFDEKDSLSLVHPGISPTGITSGYPKVIRALIKYPMKLIFMSPKKASNCVLSGIYRPTGREEWICPRVFGIWGKPKASRLRACAQSEADALLAWLQKNLPENDDSY